MKISSKDQAIEILEKGPISLNAAREICKAIGHSFRAYENKTQFSELDRGHLIASLKAKPSDAQKSEPKEPDEKK